MRYRASFLAYAFWVHKNATPKNWLMRVKGLICRQLNKEIIHKNDYVCVFSGIKTLKEADISFLPYESNVCACVPLCCVYIIEQPCVSSIIRIFFSSSNYINMSDKNQWSKRASIFSPNSTSDCKQIYYI